MSPKRRTAAAVALMATLVAWTGAAAGQATDSAAAGPGSATATKATDKKATDKKDDTAAQDSEPPRPLHGSLTVGAFASRVGLAERGPKVELEVQPGGRFGRWGLMFTYRGLDGWNSGMMTLGASYEAGAARPRLVVGFDGELGLDTVHDLAVLGGGARARVGMWGSLVLVLRAGGLFYFDGLDTSLALGGSLTVGVAW